MNQKDLEDVIYEEIQTCDENVYSKRFAKLLAKSIKTVERKLAIKKVEETKT